MYIHKYILSEEVEISGKSTFSHMFSNSICSQTLFEMKSIHQMLAVLSALKLQLLYKIVWDGKNLDIFHSGVQLWYLSCCCCCFK